MFNKVIQHLFSSLFSEKGYASLFKASIFLMGCFLVALSQAGTILYDKDLNAYKSQFSIEAALNKPLETIDCLGLLQTQRVECLMAKHEIKILNSSVGLLGVIIRLIFVLSLVSGALSVIGFCYAPFYNNSESPK